MTNRDLRMILRDITCLIKDPWNYKIFIREGINDEKIIKVANQVKCFYTNQKEDYILTEYKPQKAGRKKAFVEGSKEEFDGNRIKSILIKGIKECKDKDEFIKKTREAKTMLYKSDGFTERQKDVIWSGVWQNILKY